MSDPNTAVGAAPMSHSRAISERLIPTVIYDDATTFQPGPDSVYLFNQTDELRSELALGRVSGSECRYVRVTECEDETITVGKEEYSVDLYQGRRLRAIWELFDSPRVYIDITGLSHHVWAPLINSALEAGRDVRAVYAEPAEYVRSAGYPRFYDLSESMVGIRPLPGFATLQPTYDNVCFVPLLGFEEARFSYVMNKVGPPQNKTYPVIGVPGFRPEYPFETYRLNLRALQRDQEDLYLKAQFADASCPFRLFHLLEDIAASHPQDILKIALLGTKPHALGAVLYAMALGRRVELVYDHPLRKPGRTKGLRRVFVYHVAKFLPRTNLSLVHRVR